MKKIFKKNQVIVTALAIMIAVAGYLHFAKENVELATEETLKTQADEFYEDDLLTSSEDILSEDSEIVVSADDIENQDSTYTNTEADTDESETEVTETEVTETEVTETEAVPGDSILTSATSTSNMIKEAKLDKEQLRSKNEATLKEIINSETLTDVEKQNAVDAMVKITENSEKEEAAELLLEAKGYANSIVTMDDNSVDVVIDLAEMSDTQRAQIEEVVSRKTGVAISNIVITPVVNE